MKTVEVEHDSQHDVPGFLGALEMFVRVLLDAGVKPADIHEATHGAIYENLRKQFLGKTPPTKE